MIAAQYGNTDVVQYLVTECGANVNAANADGYTAIRFAAERGHDVILRFLTRFLLVHQPDVSETMIARSVPSDATVNKAPSWVIPPSEISLEFFAETDASSHVTFEHEVHFWHRLRHPNVIKIPFERH
ncbi:hypothetical protein PF006_g26022 [Phytophthora fragariae]|uniref:Uncharacterized protein n=1 Tax=Phytophthora fragariae TaxID=53985 RepID=A0A6A3QZL8_9STRA|nr:hypothetical protein PF006_g26022 [Phytophthora fragariae]